MTAVFWVVVAVLMAGLGTLLRAVATGVETSVRRRSLATLVVNVVGSGILGWLTARGVDRDSLVFGVFGLGALTTFSSFVGLVVELHESGNRRAAAAYAIATVVASITAAQAFHGG